MQGANDPADQVSTDAWNENHTIDDEVIVPAANKINLFAKKIAGFLFPSYVMPTGHTSALELSKLDWRIGFYTSTSSNGVLQVGLSMLTAGTATAAVISTASKHQSMIRTDYLVTVAAATAVAGARSSVATLLRGNAANIGGFIVNWKWAPATGVSTATMRAFFGMTASVAALTDVQPSSLLNMIGCGWDSADTNIQIMSNDGSGAATKIDLGASFPVPTTDRPGPYGITLSCVPNASTVEYEFIDYASGLKANGSIIVDLPANTTALAPSGYCSVGGTSSVVGFTLFDLVQYNKY